MRQRIFLTALLTAATVIAAAQMVARDTVTTAEEEIRRLENEQVDARLRRDFAALDRIWADEFVFTNSRGSVRSKAQVLADYQADSTLFDQYSIADLRIRIYGDAGVVTGRRQEKARIRGEPRADDVRFIRVYVKRNGQWKVVAGQVTPLFQP